MLGADALVGVLGLDPLAGTSLSKRLLAAFDRDNDGACGLEDFVASLAALHRSPGAPEQRLALIFSCFDADDDGALGSADLQSCMSALYAALAAQKPGGAQLAALPAGLQLRASAAQDPAAQSASRAAVSAALAGGATTLDVKGFAAWLDQQGVAASARLGWSPDVQARASDLVAARLRQRGAAAGAALSKGRV